MSLQSIRMYYYAFPGPPTNEKTSMTVSQTDLFTYNAYAYFLYSSSFLVSHHYDRQQ